MATTKQSLDLLNAQLQKQVVTDLQIMSKATNYHKWLLSQFEGFIGDRVLDLGAGIGTYTEMLLDKQLVVAVDCVPECINHLLNRFRNFNNVIPFQMNMETDSLLPMKHLLIDTIICFNVLEHIKDDSLLLQKLNDLLIPEGRLLLVVPAYPALYGSIDETVGHYRRYTKKDLTNKLLNAGFAIEKLFRMNSLAVPGWFVVNRILRKKEQSQKMILAYDNYVIPILSKIEKLIPPPVGLSLVAVGRKEKICDKRHKQNNNNLKAVARNKTM